MRRRISCTHAIDWPSSKRSAGPGDWDTTTSTRQTCGRAVTAAFGRHQPSPSDRDYGYLWHTDGALYKTADYTKMLDQYLPDWRTGAYTPNDLEGLVAARKREWAPHVGPHLGPIKPTCITWQLNLARRDYASGSPAFELPETRLDVLAQAYLEGKRVDNEKLYAALQSDPFRFNQGGDRPTHVRACEEASRFWAECVR